MNLNDYQSLANRTLRPDKPEDMLMHAGLGLATEAGEYLDTMKRFRFYGKDLDRANLIEEVGDVLWYCAAAARALDVSLDEIATANVAKLRARYPAGFTEHDAIHRDTTAEGLAMASNGGTEPTQATERMHSHQTEHENILVSVWNSGSHMLMSAMASGHGRTVEEVEDLLFLADLKDAIEFDDAVSTANNWNVGPAN